MFFEVLGILSSIIFIAGDLPYLIDTIKAKIKPHRVTWGIVALLNSIGFANQLASGARNSLWLFGAAILVTGSIFLAALKNGVGGHSLQDVIIMAICLSGVALWVIFNTPVFSIFASVFVATIALLPTFKKAKRSPKTETRIAWSLGSLSALLATISVGKLDWRLLLIPAWSTILQAYMVYLLYFRNKSSPQL